MPQYLQAVLAQVPRILGQLDRNPWSSTYGCFDRSYWHYRVVDFPCARCQEAALALVMLHQLPGSAYTGSPFVLRMAEASLGFWAEIQARNGSFNEWYPGENSYVATAFSTCAAAEALIRLGDGSAPTRDRCAGACVRAAEWLMKGREPEVGNQEAGAIAALGAVSRLTGERRFRDEAERKLSALVEQQSSEGWLPEYGGADAGYLSVGIDYLARYHGHTGSELARTTIRKAVAFLAALAMPDGSWGGTYASRNTEYLAPGGLEAAASMSDCARFVSNELRRSIARHESVDLAAMDDRYVLYNVSSYLYAHEVSSSESEPAAWCPDESQRFRVSGIIVVRKKDYTLVINVRKGGAFRVVFSNGRSFEDSGILAETWDRRKLSAGWLGSSRSVRASDDSISASGSMSVLRDSAMTFGRLTALRTVGLAGRVVPTLPLAVKQRLRRKLITGCRSSSVDFTRTVEVKEDHLCVRDEIGPANGLRRIGVGIKAPLIYVPSSRFFQNGELDSAVLILTLSPNTSGLPLVVERRFSCHGVDVLRMPPGRIDANGTLRGKA